MKVSQHLKAVFLVCIGFLIISSSEAVDLPFRESIKKGNVLYLSGQIPFGENGPLVDGSISEQTIATLNQIEAELTANGFTKSDLVQCSIYLSDFKDYEKMNNAYRDFFGSTPFPTRTVVGGVDLYAGLKIEITCTAHRE